MPTKDLVIDSKTNFTLYCKLASAGQTGACHQDVVKKQNLITTIVKTCHPTTAFTKHLIDFGA
jgi:hypothetical protein